MVDSEEVLSEPSHFAPHQLRTKVKAHQAVDYTDTLFYFSSGPLLYFNVWITKIITNVNSTLVTLSLLLLIPNVRCHSNVYP